MAAASKAACGSIKRVPTIQPLRLAHLSPRRDSTPPLLCSAAGSPAPGHRALLAPPHLQGNTGTGIPQTVSSSG
jgi:hypothetical protein